MCARVSAGAPTSNQWECICLKCEKPRKTPSFVSFNFCVHLRERRRRLAATTGNTNTVSYMAESVLMERARIKFGTNNDITGHQTIRLLLGCERAPLPLTRFACADSAREWERVLFVFLSVALIFDKLNALRTHEDTTGVYSHQALGRAESPSPPDSVTSFWWKSANREKDHVRGAD